MDYTIRTMRANNFDAEKSCNLVYVYLFSGVYSIFEIIIGYFGVMCAAYSSRMHIVLRHARDFDITAYF